MAFTRTREGRERHGLATHGSPPTATAGSSDPAGAPLAGEPLRASAPHSEAIGAIDELLSIVSHELRTPLTAIKGCARTLLRHGRVLEPELANQLLEDIDHEAERLHRLLENLLELSRAGQGAQATRRAPTAIDGLIRHVVADVTLRAGERQFRLALATGLPLPTIDAVQIEQVVRNLLENAVKYSPPRGAIDVTAMQDDDAIAVTVTDDGPGVAPEHRARIFERFFHVEPARMHVGGSGLGLAICRRFVELHGGTIELVPDGSNRRGASFRFTLPLESEVAW